MTTAAQLDERYGRVKNPRRRLLGWIIVGVVGAGLLAYVTWATLAASIGSVRVDNLAFNVVDDHSVTVEFQYSGPRDANVACVVEALDEEHGSVGWKVVEYTSDGTHGRHTVTIPTIAEATTGLAQSCWVP